MEGRVGTSLNWLTVEQVADAADFAYRRRFLLDKYPHLRDDTAAENSLAFVMGLGSLDDIEDEDITVLGIAIEEGLELPGELPPGVNDRPDAETA